jgi:two-component system, chemotaxis family, protein-glutamate methylesterase/glutaminase
MSDPRIVVGIGGSAGAIEALTRIVAGLGAGFPAPILVVVHVPPNATSVLPQILTRAGTVPAAHAADGDGILPPRLSVAPPDHHLTVEAGRLCLDRGPSVNRNRPAIDVLFRSLAETYGSRCIGVVLSGNLDDGSAGLLAISRAGGTTIVQDPEDAMHPDMPRNAMDQVAPDHVVPASAVGALLRRLVAEETGDAPARVSDGAVAGETPHEPAGRMVPTKLSCPDCGGVLDLLEDGSMAHYECQVGHVYSTESLFAAQTDRVEQALWLALRSLEEKARVARRLAGQFAERGHPRSAESYARRAENADAQAEVLRSVVGGRSTARRSPPKPTHAG